MGAAINQVIDIEIKKEKKKEKTRVNRFAVRLIVYKKEMIFDTVFPF